MKQDKFYWNYNTNFQIGIGPLFGLTTLRLIREGLKPDKLVLLSIPLLPIQWILPFVCKRHFEGSQGLERFAYMLLSMWVSAIFNFLFFLQFFWKCYYHFDVYETENRNSNSRKRFFVMNNCLIIYSRLAQILWQKL